MKEFKFDNKTIKATIQIESSLPQETLEASVNSLMRHLSSEVQMSQSPDLRERIIAMRGEFLLETLKTMNSYYASKNIQVPQEVTEYLKKSDPFAEWLK